MGDLNEKQTETELEMARYAGLYKIGEDDDRIIYGRGFDDSVMFDKLSETVVFSRSARLDLKMLRLLKDRAAELGWR